MYIVLAGHVSRHPDPRPDIWSTIKQIDGYMSVWLDTQLVSGIRVGKTRHVSVFSTYIVVPDMYRVRLM